MELNKRTIRKGEFEGAITHQMQMEIDINVPDAKDDIVKVLQCGGNLHITEVSKSDQYLRVVGNLQYQILCATDDEDHRVSCLEGKMTVDELIYIEGQEGAKYMVKCNQLDLAANMIHSRKLNVKAMVELCVDNMAMVEEELSTGVEIDDKVMTKVKSKKVLQLQQFQKDTYRIKEEVKLPSVKENIGKILMAKVGCHKVDTRAGQDEITFRGEYQFFCMYITDEWKEDWVDVNIPFEGRMDCHGLTDEMYHVMDTQIQDLTVDIQMDEDGELRVFGVEATLEMDVIVYCEEEMEILEDMYTLDKKCVLKEKNIQVESLVLQNHSRCKVVENLSLPEIKDELLQICTCNGMIQTEQVETMEDGIHVDGILHLNFLYVNGNDKVPYASWQGMVPFSHVIDCKVEGELAFTIDGKLEQLSVAMAGNDEVEVKAVVGFNSLVKEPELITIIDTVELSEFSKEERDSQAGIIGYIYKENDQLWNLAKKYHTTVDGILSVNQVEEKDVKAGHKLLIFKENLSIL